MTTLILKTRKASHPADVLPVTISRAGCARDPHARARVEGGGVVRCSRDYTVATTSLAHTRRRLESSILCTMRRAR